jgi:ABC-2 type transport system ATP-binding protein
MNILEAHNVCKSFATHQALTDVSIEVPKGCIFGLLGPNGAGKTTLIRIINQITGPDSGEVIFNGSRLKREHVHLIGYLPEERGLYKKMKVGEQAMYLAQLKGLSATEAKKELKEWFERFDIMPWWNKKVEELSKGMAQKVQFVTTVIHKPQLLILDEPFSGFDPINIELIRKEILRLRDEGSTIVLSTHNMGSVEELCDKITLINNSHVVLSGDVDAIRAEHSANLYELKFEGNMIAFTNALWTNYELLEKESEKNSHTCTVRILGDKSVNDLIHAIIGEVEIREIRKVVRSMTEIFIQTVENVNLNPGEEAA